MAGRNRKCLRLRRDQARLFLLPLQKEIRQMRLYLSLSLASEKELAALKAIVNRERKQIEDLRQGFTGELLPLRRKAFDDLAPYIGALNAIDKAIKNGVGRQPEP